jgi:hypothetical protein
MKKTFLDRRIPSFIGLLFLAISVGMVSWYGQQFTKIFTRAAGGETPKNIQISNITDTSFTVSYITDYETISTLGYGKDKNLVQIALDDRDRQSGKATSHHVHYFTLSGLSPGSKYFFAIQSGSSTSLNNGQAFEATTRNAPFEDRSQQAYVVNGSAHLPDGNIPLEGIAYLSAATASPSAQLSVLLQPDGSYSFKDLRAFAPLADESLLKLAVTNGSLESHVSVLTKYTNSVPLITLSKDYDFSLISSNSGEVTSVASVSGFPLRPIEIASGPAILTPKDAEKFKDAQPLFQGTAVPGETVNITIQSNQEMQTTVQADNFGNWQFRPTSPLSPGEHTITIVTKNVDGILQTIKRSFTVYAEGSQFTDAISPTQTPTPTILITVAPSVILPPIPITSTPTPTPTTMPTLTAVPTTIPTPILSQPIMPTVTAAPMQPTGSSDIIVGGIVAIVLFIAGGFVLFFL